MINYQKEWVILGILDTGETFEVSNWPEFLCGMLSTNENGNRVNYSEYLLPAYIAGHRAVIVAASLAADDPKSCEIVKQFVSENRLKTRQGRNSEALGQPPAQSQERRNFIKG